MAPAALHDSTPDFPSSPVQSAMNPIGTPRHAAASLRDSFQSHANANYGPIGSGRIVSNGAATPPAEDVGVRNLVSRSPHTKETEAMKSSLLEEVLARYARLQQKHNDLLQQHYTQADRDSEREEAYQTYIAGLADLLNRNPFVLILIDGDHMVFQNHLLHFGEKGGRQAADMLRDAVAKWAKSIVKETSQDIKIVARIYADAKGLAETCRRAEIAASPELIEDFFRGFTAQNGLFNFIDAGTGKDGAGVKMKADMELHLENFQCRHILFGCSHNNGLFSFLEQHSTDEEATSRVTLIEGASLAKELLQLPYQKLKIEGVFRDKIVISPPGLQTNMSRFRPDSKYPGSAFNPASGVFTPSSRTPAPEFDLTFVTPPPSLCDALTRTNSNASIAANSETAPVKNSSGGSAWANIARASAMLPFTDLKRPAPDSKQKMTGLVVLQNKQGQRIDQAMDYNVDRVYELKKARFCNQHYIGRGCCHWIANNDACPYEHESKLSKEDLKWLRVIARETVCRKGSSCVDFECIYGHHCPYPKLARGPLRGISCLNGDDCRFSKAMHGMDMAVVKTLLPQELE